MAPMEMFAGFDVLAWGVVVGTLGLLGSLIWVLVDDRPIQDRLQAKADPGTGTSEGTTSPQTPKAPRRRRAA